MPPCIESANATESVLATDLRAGRRPRTMAPFIRMGSSRMVADPDSIAMLEAAKSQATAAWVQAWGSVGAIFAAGLIAGWQGHSERRLRKATERIVARDLAMVIYRPLQLWADRAESWLRTMASDGGMGEWAIISQFAGSPERMAPPDEVMQFFGRFRDFGPAAHALQGSVVAWNMIEGSKENIRALWHRASEMQDVRADGMAEAITAIREYAKAVVLAAEITAKMRVH